MHVVGAGLAGLAAAVELAVAGRQVTLYESRARMPAGAAARISMPSSASASTTATICCCPATGRRSRYLELIGALETFERTRRGGISFVDAGRPGSAGRCGRTAAAVPWWVLQRCAARAGDARARLSSACWRCARRRRCDGGRGARPATARCSGRLWQPLTVAALNTGVERALGPAVMASPGRNARARRRCMPAAVPRDGLSESFVDPALANLAPARRRDALRRAAARDRVRPGIGSQPWSSIDGPRRAVGRRGRFDPRRSPAAMAARLVPGSSCRMRSSRRSSTRISAMSRHPPDRRCSRRRRRHRRVDLPQARGVVGDGQRRRADRRLTPPRN